MNIFVLYNIFLRRLRFFLRQMLHCVSPMFFRRQCRFFRRWGSFFRRQRHFSDVNPKKSDWDFFGKNEKAAYL